uniref:DUF629 domain-containing protein n=1 Tax=Oryza brachyantha TaxID=4533 RepID=J3N9G2_ORYBR
MNLRCEGSATAAIAQAVKLGLKHGDSALVLNLVGTLHQISYAACKFMAWSNAGSAAEESSEAAGHKSSALYAFSGAARLAPKCVSIAVSHAQMLIECERYDDAYDEIIRALTISKSDPVDPAENDVAYDLYDGDTTRAERLQKAMVVARHAMERITTVISEQFIPMESARVLDGIKLGGDATANARARAKHLAATYPFAPRVHVLRAFVDLERVRGFDPAIDKRRFLRRTLDMVHEAAETFPLSLVIALFRARLLFVLDQYDDAEHECRKAIALESPQDPKADDLPPGSVSGAEYDDRVSFVKNQLRTLMKKIILTAAIYLQILTSEEENSLMSVRTKPLIQSCDEIDKSSAKTITDALRFFKHNSSWSFWICPLSNRCDRWKFVDTSSLWIHLCSKHPEGSWGKLQSVLGPKLCENTSEGDCSSLKWITCSQDSDQNDIFRLIKVNDMFDSLIRLVEGGTEPDLVEMRTEKCREGAEILEGIKGRMETLPTDISSSQFDDARSEIQNMWLKFLINSVLDYQEVIFPFVRSFIWAKLKKRMTGDPNIVGHISSSKIDPVFEDGNSGDVEGTAMEIAEILLNMKCSLELEGDSSPTTPLPATETYGQSMEEMANTTRYQSVDVVSKENNDKDLFILHAIIQSLWNLRFLRDEILMGKPAWILNMSHNCCMADLIHEIFSAWGKNEQGGVAALLSSVKTSLCKIANGDMFQKFQAGKQIASEVVATILEGLHRSEASLHFYFNSEIEDCELKSFSELPVLYDEQLCFDDNCEYCGSPNIVDISPWSAPHFFTIGLDWSGGCENQVNLSEVLLGIAHPLDIKLLCKGVRSSANYALASMISYADERYICFARDEDKWLICDAGSVEAVDSWGQLLERFRDSGLQPEVLFFEVIK